MTIASTRPKYGAWAAVSSPEMLESIARVGYDWVCLDLQHGAYGFSSARRAIQLLDVLEVPTLIRLSWRDLHIAPRLLDAGAEGIIVAMVLGPEIIENAVAMTRYQPRGSRSYGGQRWGLRRPLRDGPDLEPIVFAMIETPAAVQAVEEIASVPGITGLFLGEADLGLGLGLGIDPDAVRARPEHQEAIQRVVDAARGAEIDLGNAARDGAEAARWAAAGFTWIALGSDIDLFQATLKHNLDVARTGTVAKGGDAESSDLSGVMKR